jgi:MFS transporter, SP family, sugar:H+ symporter
MPQTEKKLRHLPIYIFAALADVLFGYDVGVIGVALLFIRREISLTAFHQGLIVSSLLIGAMIGVLSAGRLADRYGRRPMLLMTGVVYSVGAVGAALGTSIGMLIFFRLVMGLAVGASSVVVTIYLAEMAPSGKRGALTSLNQLMVTIGILVAYIVDYALSPFGAWRWMFGLGLVPSLVLLVGISFQPETPRWLMKHGQEKKARDVLARFIETSRIDAEIAEMKEVYNKEGGGTAWGELFAPWFRKILIIAIGMAIFPQIMGINSIVYYAPNILTNIGFGTSAAILANVGIGIINVLMTVVAIRLIDRVGRKPLLLFGTTGMALSLLVIGLVYFTVGNPAAAWIILIFIALFVASFAVSWGTVVRVLISEILPLQIRGTVMGFVLVFNWGFNFLVGLIFPVVLQAAGLGRVFFGFAVVSVAAFLFVRYMVPETKGKSLEELELSFREAGR